MQITMLSVRPAWLRMTRLLNNSEGNRNGEWVFCRRKEVGDCFVVASDKNKKNQRNLR